MCFELEDSRRHLSQGAWVVGESSPAVSVIAMAVARGHWIAAVKIEQ